MKSKKKKSHPPILIGWREYISIPKLGIDQIKVKVDTGARTSSLHVSELHFYKRGDNEYVDFVVHPKQRSVKPIVKARAKVLEYRNVKSSTGHSSKRPVILAKIQVGDFTKEIEITLTNRDEMGFRMLLGREAVRKDFIIDPGKSYLGGAKDSLIKKLDLI